MSARFTHSFEFEQTLWQQGVARIAGVDEAGRGPLPGSTGVRLCLNWKTTHLLLPIHLDSGCNEE